MTRSGMISSSSRPRKDYLSKRFIRDRIHYFDLYLDLHLDLETIQRKFCFKIVKIFSELAGAQFITIHSQYSRKVPVFPSVWLKVTENLRKGK